MNHWWVLHDQDLRHALDIVEDGTITAAEAYAVLNEHSAYHPHTPSLRVTTTEDDTAPAERGDT